MVRQKGLIAMAKDWYGKKGDKDKHSDKKEESKPEGMHERHSRERGETHGRHAKAREDMNKQHEEEIASMAARHADEAAVSPGGNDGAPAGPAPVQGAAGGTPPVVAGATPAGAAA
jgi:hypothetical protein